MKKTKGLIEVHELKKQLSSIVEDRLPICFRYRLMCDMWQPNFMRVLKVDDDGVLLNDEVRNRLISITDLSNIIQFEFDAPLRKFQPHFHYELTDKEI
jgi:hypothetical protein